MLDSDITAQDVSELTSYSGRAATSVPDQELGKDDFLQMLITQLRYQDPMDPMKDQEFIAQMAQFSSLEQLTNMNENLSDNLNWNYLLSQTINNTMATSLIGHEVKAIGNEVYLSDDGEVKLRYELGAYAESATIDILDGSGSKVASYTVSKVGEGEQTFEWDGRTLNGEDAQPGTYTFRVTAVGPDGQNVLATPFRSGLVEGVQYVDSQAYLVIAGTKISLGDVMEVGLGNEDG
jgi:flagellar basal-body rod modification protein FlgD